MQHGDVRPLRTCSRLRDALRRTLLDAEAVLIERMPRSTHDRAHRRSGMRRIHTCGASRALPRRGANFPHRELLHQIGSLGDTHQPEMNSLMWSAPLSQLLAAGLAHFVPPSDDREIAPCKLAAAQLLVMRMATVACPPVCESACATEKARTLDQPCTSSRASSRVAAAGSRQPRESALQCALGSALACATISVLRHLLASAPSRTRSECVKIAGRAKPSSGRRAADRSLPLARPYRASAPRGLFPEPRSRRNRWITSMPRRAAHA